jgi:hypothetical protein
MPGVTSCIASLLGLRSLGWQVVVEEFPKPVDTRGKSTEPTERYIGGVITPACPIYEHALSYQQELDDIDSASHPLLGECSGHDGISGLLVERIVLGTL